MFLRTARLLATALCALAILLVTACWAQSAKATEPSSDLCALLPASQVSAVLGTAYDSPQKSVAPRFSSGTVTGTDCNYQPKDAEAAKLLFRGYVDASVQETTWLFVRLSKFYKTTTPVPGLGDEAYFDDAHGLHVRKGKTRLFFNLAPVDTFSAEKEKQMKALAAGVIAQL
ncbi:MAG: hypothetical protein WBC78_16670 [Candidatus Sulfotelmatobacter sp.]